MLYNHNLIEKKWQQYWKEHQTYKFVDQANNKKFYGLDMFPYPSGSGLHVGHLKGYMGTEILSRLKKMQGYDVLHPIGWDAFGLPAERYAVLTKNHPATFTYENINNFRNQLQRIGFCFDYNKEVDTTDPQYFKTTQWIFSQMVKHNLAEVQAINVNWCSELKTVLANEEVIIKNNQRVSERGEFPVVYKPMKQWVLKITQYADRLIDDLDLVDWPEGIKEHQRKWIGRMLKYQFKLYFENELFLLNLNYASNFHHLAGVLVNEHHQIVQTLLQNPKYQTTIKNYFTNKNQHEPLILEAFVTSAFENRLFPIVLSNKLDEKNPEMIPWFLQKEVDLVDLLVEDQFVKTHLNTNFQKVITYKLKDWIFSRQRYWGEPIPVYFDQNNQIHLETNLPLQLPVLSNFEPGSDGQSPLVHAIDWLVFYNQSAKFVRETNTMPNWAGSCWYYLGYLLKNADQSYTEINSPTAWERFEKWLPVDVYIGGQEHAVLHLLYARFWHKFLYDLKVVPTKEPFMCLINQGMILGPDGQKMSKSKNNVINPDEIVDSHGADALRLYECFMGPITTSLPWSEKNLNAVRKWVDRVYSTFMNLVNFIQVSDNDQQMQYLEAKLLSNFEDCVNKSSFNVGVSEMMIFINMINQIKQYSNQAMISFLKVFSLYAPHLAEELWFNIFHQTQSIYHSQWPKYNPQALVSDEHELPIMINNKLRLVLKLSNKLSAKEVEDEVLHNPTIGNLLHNQKVVKIIHVPQKIFNIIVEN